MKKILLLSICAVVFTNASAQVPKKVATSLVHKVTATWCGPCGAWGWTLADELIAGTTGKALYMNLYASSSTSMQNNWFYNATAIAAATQITFAGYPDFGNNFINHTKKNTTTSGINTTGIKSDIFAAVNAFALTTPVASPANSMTITGSTINVDARVKFWSATSGDYYLAAYMIEDGALNLQNSQTGTVAHHDVLRGSMSTSAWGELIASGSIAANAYYKKTFTFTITDSKWDKAKMKIYTILFKKVGSTYEFVNVSANEAPTSINSVAGVNEVKLSPNPSMGDNTTVSIQSTESQNLNISVVDMTGRVVYSEAHNIVVGQNNLNIPSGNFAQGMYQVMISSDNGTIVEKLSVVR